MKKVLHIDIETYSDEDLSSVGVYKYSQSEEFEILLFAFAYDGGPVKVIDLWSGQKIPDSVLQNLQNPEVTKVAHNASFERICLSEYLRRKKLLKTEYLDPEEWECTMVHAMMLGLPGSLKGVGQALNFSEDKAKDKDGKALIRYFCVPCKATKVNGGRTRNFPYHDREKWNRFIEYNRQDVVAEQAIHEKLARFPIPENERKLYALDQRINDNGILADSELIYRVRSYAPVYTQKLVDRCIEITGVKPTQTLKLKDWIITHTNFDDITSIDKKSIERMFTRGVDTLVSEVLDIRLEAGSSSVKKYDSFHKAQCKDERVHGAFQFYGASHTGRWAGRLIQPQNFPRNDFDDVDVARKLIINAHYDEAEILYGSLTSVFKTLVRTIVIAPEGKTLAVADYSAIEARVIAWLAKEKWRQDAFKNGKDIYCESASMMFGVPVEKHGANSHLRKKGKIAELALGYAGGVGALKAFGAEDMGLTEEEMQSIVQKWRQASPKIKRMWYEFENAAKACIESGETTGVRDIARFTYEGGILFMQIPSGRKLAYPKAKIGLNDFGNDGLIYYEMNTVSGEWEPVFTRGGVLVENICQAVARDCLAEAMKRIEKEYSIVMHVHDEVIVEVPEENADYHLKRIEYLMSNAVDQDSPCLPWAKGLLLTAEGFTSKYYRKD